MNPRVLEIRAPYSDGRLAEEADLDRSRPGGAVAIAQYRTFRLRDGYIEARH